MGWFDSNETKERRFQFKNMISLALIDGEFDDNEKEFLRMRGIGLGLSRGDVDTVLKHPERVKFVSIKDPDRRIQHLYDLVIMMIADGKIVQAEMDFVQTLAAMMGFRPSDVPRLLESIVESARQKAKPTIDAEEFLDV